MLTVKDTDVILSPAIISWAMERVHLTEADLTGKYPKLTQWLAGNGQITVKQLEALSTTLKVPFGFMLLSEVPLQSNKLPDFRTLSGAKLKDASVALREQIMLLRKRQEWLSAHMKEDLSYEPLTFVGKYAQEVPNSQVLAAEIASTLDLDLAEGRAGQPDAFMRYLVSKIEAAGITVSISSAVGTNTHLSIEVNECRGFVLVDEYAPFIYINAKDAKAAQIFSLIHELAHIWLGHNFLADGTTYNKLTKVEAYCNEVAAELLVDRKSFETAWIAHSGDTLKLAKAFKVSEYVIGIRAKGLGYWTQENLHEFLEVYKRRAIAEAYLNTHKEKSGGGDFYANQQVATGRGFLRILKNAVLNGYVRFTDAYRLSGASGYTYEKLMNKLT